MILQPALPGGYAVFCDDIRYEVSGKVTLVGMYTGNMSIATDAPVKLVRLGVVIVYRAIPRDFEQDVTFKVIRDRPAEELFSATVKQPVSTTETRLEDPADKEPERTPFTELRLHTTLEGVEISERCRLKVRAYIGDDEIRLGSLNVTFADRQADAAAPVRL